MTASYRLVFVSENGQETSFDLNSSSFVPAGTTAAPVDQTILVLPASGALPFQLELPFSDPVKIARVLPQFVADLYVDVDESWRFSWLVVPQNQGNGACLVSGLAFPARLAEILRDGTDRCRLAIADLMLAGAQAGQALQLVTPVAESIAIFNGPYSVRRLFSATSGMPVELLLNGEGIESCHTVKLGENAGDLCARIDALMTSEHEALDLSGFRQKRRAGLRSLAATAGALLLLAWVFIWHFFLWLECRITERAAQRTRSHMQQAFSAVFPGVPVVEPLTQTDRSIAELEKRLKEATTVPILPWQSTLQLLSTCCGPDTPVLRLSGRTNGLKLSGIAINYAALEAFRTRLENSGRFEKVNTAESRQGSSGINFSLEAVWKN